MVQFFSGVHSVYRPNSVTERSVLRGDRLRQSCGSAWRTCAGTEAEMDDSQSTCVANLHHANT